MPIELAWVHFVAIVFVVLLLGAEEEKVGWHRDRLRGISA